MSVSLRAQPTRLHIVPASLRENDINPAMTLAASFIQSILEKIDTPDVIGIGLLGSYAHRQESKYSDVDIDIYVNRSVVNKSLQLIKEAGPS